MKVIVNENIKQTKEMIKYVKFIENEFHEYIQNDNYNQIKIVLDIPRKDNYFDVIVESEDVLEANEFSFLLLEYSIKHFHSLKFTADKDNFFIVNKVFPDDIDPIVKDFFKGEGRFERTPEQERKAKAIIEKHIAKIDKIYNQTILFVDSKRNPFLNYDYMIPDDYPIVKWVRDYGEFIKYVNLRGLPKAITFDEDYIDTNDMLSYLKTYCRANNEKMPDIFYHRELL